MGRGSGAYSCEPHCSLIANVTGEFRLAPERPGPSLQRVSGTLSASAVIPALDLAVDKSHTLIHFGPPLLYPTQLLGPDSDQRFLCGEFTYY